MKTFLRFLGNLATVIIAFVLYKLLQLGYAQKKVNLLFAIILAVLTVANGLAVIALPWSIPVAITVIEHSSGYVSS